MRYAIILTLLMFSCSTDPTVTLVGQSEYSTTCIYQDSQCYFIAAGLNKLVEEGQADSASFSFTAPFGQGIFEFGLADFVNDTFDFILQGDILLPDRITENFSDEPTDGSFIGQLSIYSNGSITTSTDTIKIDTINPLKNDRMTGELVENHRHGQWLEFYDEERTELARKSNFIHGRRHGQDSIFKNGKLYMYSEWIDGRKHGDFFVYWPNGTIKYKTKFGNGKPIELMYTYTSIGELSDSTKIGF